MDPVVINVYCDESCHLEHDRQSVMLIGGIWCIEDEVSRISKEIRELKDKYNARGEIKWGKVSPSRLDLFKSLVDYFFNCQHLNFRCLVVDDKSKLNHSYFNQGSHDSFYYKMYFFMLRHILKPDNTYNIYIDIKDTRSIQKVNKLGEILCNNARDFDKSMIRNIQHVRSNEIELLQLADFFIGAISYQHRYLASSPIKTNILNRIKNYAGHNFMKSTPPWEEKFNIFVFSPSKVE